MRVLTSGALEVRPASILLAKMHFEPAIAIARQISASRVCLLAEMPSNNRLSAERVDVFMHNAPGHGRQAIASYAKKKNG